MSRLYLSRQICAIRALGWQLDWRRGDWEPLFGFGPRVRVLRVGKLCRFTLGPLERIDITR
ncbi:hypothetical protein [Nocardioides alcanivorans]|uniref:hypothetical protein n=1 Tax=Nocardioides alcanivorans TaxID=2897352 RepID=UPI001F43067F|nr:hypothetical protein [Nocardioides alcanivorans]